MRSVMAVVGLSVAGLAIPGAEFDLKQPQSPPKPWPVWVKIIDQGQNHPDLKGYFTPEGLKVEIVATEPAVINPVGMTFADDGTLHVLEWRPDAGNSFPEFTETVKYKDGTTRQIKTMKKKVKDVVKTLHHTGERGERGASAPWYDQAKVVMDDVELPSSILLHDGWLYLTGRGSVWRYKSSKNDGNYDVKEEIAKGFCGFHHHQVSGLTIGNDGWLYITSGDNDNFVEGSDGSRATVLRTGAVFRCRPDGSKMQVYALGFRNPYRDVAFDAACNMFHADNDNEDGSKFTGCRLMHVAEEADYGWRLRTGAACCQADTFRGAVYGELPGKLPPLLKTGRGAPAGLLIYNDTFFPEKFRGLLLYPDAYRKLIRAYRVEPRGSTFEIVEEFEFMRSDDPLFRPCQMVAGPDGAIYVCDWRTNSGGAGQLWGDGQHGRIYRISWAGTPEDPAIPLRSLDSWTKIIKGSDEELLKTLESENFSDRQRAQRELARRGEKQRPALLKVLADSQRPIHARIAALGALQSMWNAEVKAAFIKALDASEKDLRRLAADGLALNCQRGDQDAHDALVKALTDPEPEVRRAVASAMGKIDAPGAPDSLVNAFRFDDGKDIYLRDGLLRAIERLGKPGIDQLLTLADSGVEKESLTVARAYAALRTRPAVESLPRMLNNIHLTEQEQAMLLRSYGDYLLEPPASVEPALDWVIAHPKVGVATKLAALEAVAAAGGNALHSEKLTTIVKELLSAKEEKERLAVIKAVQDLQLKSAAGLLVRMVSEKTRSNAEREAIIQALRALKDKMAAPVLRDILNDEKAGSLRGDALEALAVLEPETATPLAKTLLERDDATLQIAAIQVLGTQAEGAKLVAQRFLDKKLPPEMQRQVAEALRKHVARQPELQPLLDEVLKGGLVLSLKEDEVARLRKLVQEKGDPPRGKAVYLHKKAACINCHMLEGVGGNVGPDLTRIWDTHTFDKLMESLVEPSKEIKEGYSTFVLVTTKGQVFRGLKVAQNEQEVVLRDADGKEQRVPVKEIESLEAVRQSLMADNTISQLSLEEFLDLMAFLKDQKAQESLRGMAPK